MLINFPTTNIFNILIKAMQYCTCSSLYIWYIRFKLAFKALKYYSPNEMKIQLNIYDLIGVFQ